MRKLGWLFVVAVVLVSSGYFLKNVNDEAFVASTMSGLLATILGIIAGIPIAFAVSRRLENEQATAEAAMIAKENHKAAHALTTALRFELIDNDFQLRTFSATLADVSESAATTGLRWLETVGEGFSFTAFDALKAHRQVEFWQVMSVWLLHIQLRDLASSAKQTAARATFYDAYPDAAKSFAGVFTSMRSSVDRAQALLSDAKAEVEQLVTWFPSNGA